MITIEFTEKEPGLFTEQLDMVNVSNAMLKKFAEVGLLSGFQQGSRICVETCSITLEYPGITAEDGEVVKFIIRKVEEIIKEVNLSDICSVSSASKQDCNGDKIIRLNHLKPRETKNSMLLKNILPMEDVPEEYLCQLSQEIIDEPVYTTKRPDIFYNKNHLTHWLYSRSNPLDPYTNQAINAINDVIFDADKKKEIDAFVSTKLKEGLLLKQKKFQTAVKKHTGEEKITQANIDKAFRTAAARNEVNDLAILFHKVTSINAQDDNPIRKRTALHWAIEKGSVDCVKWLLDNKAEINIPDANNKTALDYASDSNNDEIKQLVLGQLVKPFQSLSM